MNIGQAKMKASELAGRLTDLIKLYGDLDIVILDAMCDQELRTLNPAAIGVRSPDEIQIEAFE